MDGKFLGKIEKAEFGIISGSNIGLIIDFVFDKTTRVSSGLTYTWKTIDSSRFKEAWKEYGLEERIIQITGDVCKILSDAKVQNVNQLKDKPIEIEIKGNLFKSFRILTEVL